jgi:ankyrin repeat protein
VQTALLLAKGFDVNAPDSGGETPLHDTCCEGRVDAARLLLSRGAHIDAQCDGKITPLEWAVAYGQPALAEFLLSQGAKPTSGSVAEAVQCCNLKVVTMLISHGADPNDLDNFHHTALDEAIAVQKTDIAKYLIAHGAKRSGN